MICLYLNERSINILKSLLQSEGEDISLEKLAKIHGISERSIRYDLESIDFFLKDQQFPELQRSTKIEIGLKHEAVSESEKKGLFKKLMNSKLFYSPEERQDYIYIELILENNIITVDYLMNLFDVSRSTINADIRSLRKELKLNNSYILYSHTRGYYVDGNEQKIRRKAINIITNSFNFMNLLDSTLLDATKNSRKFESGFIEYFEQLVNEIEKELGKVYTGNAYKTLVNSFVIVISRIKRSHYIQGSVNSSNHLNILKEYLLLKEKCETMEKDFDISIPAEETIFLVNLFLESNLLKADEYLNENWIDLYILTNELIENINKELDVNLNNDPDLFEALILHLGPAFKRMKNEVYLKNEIIQYIQETYEKLFNIVYETLNKLSENLKVQFTSDEVGFITLHIASTLEKITIQEKRLNVLLVCNSGIGTSKLLETRVEKYLSFEIIGIISIRELNNELLQKNKIDLIISTIPIHNDYFVPIIQVSPFLKENEMKRLKEFETNYSLKNVPEKASNEKEKGAYIPMLKDLLIKETIATNVNAATWEEAVRKGGRLLLSEGYIEEEYIDAMINTVKELGPYIVIAPNIAMPHANAKNGVNKIGISLITLKEPINFGHAENDPVKIVICLAAIDHSSHIKALAELVNYLNNKEFIEFLKKETSVEKIIQYINKEDENGLSKGDKQESFNIQ